MKKPAKMADCEVCGQTVRADSLWCDEDMSNKQACKTCRSISRSMRRGLEDMGWMSENEGRD